MTSIADLSSQDQSKEILIEVTMCNNYGWKQHPCYQNSGQCDICFDDSMVGKYVLETACGHAYHRNCIIMTLKNYKFMVCPTCSKPYIKTNKKEKPVENSSNIVYL